MVWWQGACAERHVVGGVGEQRSCGRKLDVCGAAAAAVGVWQWHGTQRDWLDQRSGAWKSGYNEPTHGNEQNCTHVEEQSPELCNAGNDDEPTVVLRLLVLVTIWLWLWLATKGVEPIGRMLLLAALKTTKSRCLLRKIAI